MLHLEFQLTYDHYTALYHACKATSGIRIRYLLILHFLDAHAAFFQADQVLDPGDVMRIKDAAVVLSRLTLGTSPFVSVGRSAKIARALKKNPF